MAARFVVCIYEPSKKPFQMKDTHLAKAQSLVPAPGFEILQNNENGAYYFQCNDLSGKSILQSKDYSTLKIAENSLQSALRFAKQAKNYSRKKEGDYHLFVLKSNNQQELARSILFVNEKEMQNAIAYLTQVAMTDHADSAKPPVDQPEKEVEAQKIPIKETTKAKAQPKYSFKIDLYQQADNQFLSGKIEYLLTQESATFQGLNEQAIVKFMQQHLPKTAHQVSDREAFSVQQATLQALSAPQGKPVSSVAVGSPLLFAQLKVNQPKNLEKEWTLAITARMIGSNTVVLRTESKAQMQADGSVALTLPGNYFTEGVYRLEVVAYTNAQRQEAGCIFQVY